MHIAVTSGTDCLMLRCSPFSKRAGDFGLGKAPKLKPGFLIFTNVAQNYCVWYTEI